MNAARIIYQQVVQMKRQMLACAAILMTMPIEEAIVSWRNGDGFYSTGAVLGSLLMAPFLAGLIACANVQADMDDKRYLFWRSKPVGVKSFVTLKYVVGLLLTFAVIALPITFGVISNATYHTDDLPNNRETFFYFANIGLFSLMAYSVCFFVNVLMRKTARAWIVGMAAAGFVLIVPFVLPLNYTDVVHDVLGWMSWVYLLCTLGAAAATFVLALFAAQRDWRLRTDLKWVMWAGAAAVFAVMLLLGRQVTNIKVLDEKTRSSYAGGELQSVGDQVIVGGHQIARTNNGRIELTDIPMGRPAFPKLKPKPRKRSNETVDVTTVYKKIGDRIYAFSVFLTYEPYKEGVALKRTYKSAYLASKQIYPEPNGTISEINLMEGIKFGNYGFYTDMRIIENKLILRMLQNYLVAEVNDAGGLNVIARNQMGSLINFIPYERAEGLKVRLLRLQGLNTDEQIKFSVDFWAQGSAGSSRVEVVNGKIRFCMVSEKGISLYEVIEHDEKNIQCRLIHSRPFTFLEQMFGRIGGWNSNFVKNGKLYVKSDSKLMVFDIRSEKGIRKLGQFEQLGDAVRFEDVAVLDNGDILLSTYRQHYRSGIAYREESKDKLLLLKNPGK